MNSFLALHSNHTLKALCLHALWARNSCPCSTQYSYGYARACKAFLDETPSGKYLLGSQSLQSLHCEERCPKLVDMHASTCACRDWSESAALLRCESAFLSKASLQCQCCCQKRGERPCNTFGHRRQSSASARCRSEQARTSPIRGIVCACSLSKRVACLSIIVRNT